MLRITSYVLFLFLIVGLVFGSGDQPSQAAIPQQEVAEKVADDAEAAATDDEQHGVKSATDKHKVGSIEGKTSGGLVGNIITLLMLVLLQAVLGLDNLLYISLESKRAPEDKQRMVRIWGIGLAIFLRIALLFVLVNLISYFQDPWFETPPSWVNWFDGHFNLHSIIVLLGGVFILYTAVKEVWHMIRLEHDDHAEEKPKSVGWVVFWIVLMNVVFSFDSILSAMALTDTLWVMALAIVIGGVLMIVLADTVANFLKKNRMYEVLGLFILLIVGIMLLSEGGHLAHLKFLGNEVVAMSKATFYFVIGVLVVIEIIQSRYQKKLLASKSAH
ncbi:TerC family protein [Mariniblastus fucicola]|uniref:Integral membrane protein TerC family protein n=1 Tax=Mariniblastus fucicola TaxID=980251 RepID=A0A5B9P8Z0_9BACT|nr:TerC family protein [Mariniblastus fucicola]QEG21096.1 Integral membrane protein TerC family protein [Mariniblastus fucicola]